MIQLNQIREGSKVLVRGNFGRGVAQIGVVTEVAEDIKNGAPGISYDVPGTPNSSWAYLSQIDRVETY